ncbi:hypothetical protein HPB49_013652 [Dermacentor silvarum]|uniref:Uncharacterized protein n=1 Tax=Dermacentor silvarum TaxID=543639 RepID=A0ACB8C9M0_DERSI|nr:hypothetical protein HPB49_013652 [Dermacentor silvarum]
MHHSVANTGGRDELTKLTGILLTGNDSQHDGRRHHGKRHHGKRHHVRSIRWNNDETSLAAASQGASTTASRRGSLTLAATTTNALPQQKPPHELVQGPPGAATQQDALVAGAAGQVAEAMVAMPAGLATQKTSPSSFGGTVNQMDDFLVGRQERQTATAMGNPAQLLPGRAQVVPPPAGNVEQLYVKGNAQYDVACRDPLQPWDVAAAPMGVDNIAAASNPPVHDTIEPTAVVLLFLALGTLAVLIFVTVAFTEARSLDTEPSTEAADMEPLTDFNVHPADEHVTAPITKHAETTAVQANNDQHQKHRSGIDIPEAAHGDGLVKSPKS